MKKIIVTLNIIFSVMFLFSCTRAIKPSGKANEKKVFLAFFDNQTIKPGVNEILTEFLRDIFLVSDSVKLVNKKDANYFVSGNIKEYTISAETYSDREAVEMYSIKIVVEVLIKKRTASGDFLELQSFDASDRFIFSESASVPKTEKNAVEETCRKLAFKIYNKIKQAADSDEKKDGGISGR